jgi:hypothetical protein
VSYCEHCSHSFAGNHCPLCGALPVHTPREVDKALSRDFWLVFGGLAACILISYRYTPLDLNPIMAVCLPFLFIPMTVHIVLAVRKRAAQHLPFLKNLYRYCGAFLLLLAAFLFLNGALDHTTTREIRSVVVQKIGLAQFKRRSYLLLDRYFLATRQKHGTPQGQCPHVFFGS